MSRNLLLSLAVLLTFALIAGDAFARGGRGGGGGGGRGGMGGGGGRSMGGGGGGYRPAPVNRSPSMSRTPSASRAPSAARPASRPATAARPTTRPSAPNVAGSRPTAGPGGAGRAGNLAAGAAAGAGIAAGSRTAGAFSRPSQGELNNFLGIQGEGGGAAPGRGAAQAGAAGAAGARPLDSSDGPRSFTTERGTTITVGGAGGSTAVGGGTAGAAVGGIKVETAGGATAGKVGGVAGVSGAGGAAVGGGSVSGARGTQGGSIANVSRGYADTAGNRAAGSVTAAQGRNGYAAVNARGGYGAGGTGQIGSVSGIRGPGGNVVSAGRGAAFENGQFVGGRSWAAVNGAYTRWNAFNPGWIGGYPGAWWPGKWAVWGTAWAVATWPYASGYSGCSGEPVYYDYGENVAYEDGSVYVDDQPVATAEEYYNQANEIAQAGAEASNEDWMPLGVFAIVADEGQTQTDKVIQLALNRDGIIRGNYQDMLTNQVIPVTGSVDKTTQRVSLKLQGNDQLIVETGLYNLTNDEAPVLVHFGPDRQEGRLFIRLKQPEDEAAKAGGAPRPATP